MLDIKTGDTVRVTTDTFSRSFPRGTIATVVNVVSANTPPVPYYPVPYYIVEARGRQVVMYTNEIEAIS